MANSNVCPAAGVTLLLKRHPRKHLREIVSSQPNSAPAETDRSEASPCDARNPDRILSSQPILPPHTTAPTSPASAPSPIAPSSTTAAIVSSPPPLHTSPPSPITSDPARSPHIPNT